MLRTKTIYNYLIHPNKLGQQYMYALCELCRCPKVLEQASSFEPNDGADEAAFKGHLLIPI